MPHQILGVCGLIAGHFGCCPMVSLPALFRTANCNFIGKVEDLSLLSITR